MMIKKIKKVAVATLTLGVLVVGGKAMVNASNTPHCVRTSAVGVSQSGSVCHIPNIQNVHLTAAHVSWRHAGGNPVQTDIQYVPASHQARARANNGSGNSAVTVWETGRLGRTTRARTPNNRNVREAATTQAYLRLTP